MALRYLLKKTRHNRLERFNIVISILLAGWIPSILTLVVSYSILSRTIETGILKDRGTFVELIARLVGDDLSRTGGIIDYYQTSPEVVRMLNSGNPQFARSTMDRQYVLFPSANRRNVHDRPRRPTNCIDSLFPLL